MITKEQAIKLGDGSLHVEIHIGNCQRTVGPRGGVRERIMRVRPSGRCQTWKTRQHEFRLPFKYGMYESGAITDRNASEFHLATDCPALAQERTDIRIASELQKTVDETERVLRLSPTAHVIMRRREHTPHGDAIARLEQDIKSMERIVADTSERNRDLEYESRMDDQAEHGMEQNHPL